MTDDVNDLQNHIAVIRVVGDVGRCKVEVVETNSVIDQYGPNRNLVIGNE